MAREENALMFRLQVRLKSDTPDFVIQTLRLMVGQRAVQPPKHPPEHAFGRLPGWYNLLRNLSTRTQRFASHETGCSGKFSQLKYTSGSSTLREYSGYYELKAIGVSSAEEQDFGLFLAWLSPYLVRAEGDQWLALVQAYVFYTPKAGRRRTKAGLIKLYSHPVQGGSYPTLYYRGGRLPDLVKHIL